jgi:hypothetical protein
MSGVGLIAHALYLFLSATRARIRRDMWVNDGTGHE